MPLTDTAIRNAQPSAKPRKLSDARGLYLLLNPNGSRWWRFRYRWQGKQKQLSLGVYPDVGLAEARKRRDELRRQVAEGIDPGEQRKAAKARKAGAGSFEAVAREWFEKHKPTWAASHSEKIIRRLERDVFPWLGSRPVGEITAPELLQVLRRIEGHGAVETAHRALQNAGAVFRYAVATGKAERDPSGDLRGALAPWKPDHYAAVTEPAEAAELLRTIDAYTGSIVTLTALQLAPLVFTRPGELRHAEWAEIDLPAAEWRIPAEKTKVKEALIVPLATQAVALLRALQPVTGSGRYVFPGVRTAARPMSENTLNAALGYMGYGKERMRAHGFRAMARTMLDEQLGFPAYLIEHQLGHRVRDPLGRAYNRTKHLKERRAMMQAWADYLDSLKQGGNVVALHGRTA
ncbi:MAG: integrase arm-type DNA-binding domain-containing protein [Gammaproteobacteria bacterium]|nr:integrase arm-type DNA-binding domain-containing protein [Gammaproteobacteria bacterium]